MPTDRDRRASRRRPARGRGAPEADRGHFHAGNAQIDGHDAHHTRLLLALDLSVAAACRAQGVDACDGLAADAHCEVGTLRTKTAELASALAAAIEDPASRSASDQLAALLEELRRVIGGKAPGS